MPGDAMSPNPFTAVILLFALIFTLHRHGGIKCVGGRWERA